MLSSTGTLTKDECTHCHYCTAAQATVRRGKLQLWLQWHYDSKHNTDRKLRIGCLFAQDTCDASPGLTAKRNSKLTSCNLLQYCTWSVLVKSAEIFGKCSSTGVMQFLLGLKFLQQKQHPGRQKPDVVGVHGSYSRSCRNNLCLGKDHFGFEARLTNSLNGVNHTPQSWNVLNTYGLYYF